MSVDSTLRKAAKLAKSGNRAAAAALYREVLAKFPGNATARRGLAALSAPSATPAAAPTATARRPGRPAGGALGAGLMPAAPTVAPPPGGAAKKPRQPAKKPRKPIGPAPSAAEMRGLEQRMARGDVRGAIVEGQRLALLFPRAPGLLTLMAQAHGRLGEIDKALALYDKALEIDPAFAGAHANKASLHARRGEYDAALAEARAALKIDPGLALGHLMLGYALVNTGQPAEAIAPFRQAVRRAPDMVQSHLGLGNAYAALDDPEAALAAFEAALALEPDNADALNNIANALVSLNRYEEAVKVFEKAEARDPRNDVLRINHTRALRDLGRADEAVEQCREALKIRDDRAETWGVLASVLRETGDNAGAAQAVDRAQEIDPGNLQALSMRWGLEPLPLDHPEYDRIKTLSSDETVAPILRTNFAFALFRAHDAAGDPATAMKWLLMSNRVRAESDPYDMDAHEAVLRRLMDSFRAGVAPLGPDETRDLPAPARPVFIVGMPRSGTSLVEQILASHSDVHAAGELNILGEILYEFGWHPGKKPRRFDREALRQLRREYFEHLARIGATDKPVVTDKAPLNFRHVGPALAAMPEARVLFLRRDARATCWSNLSNNLRGRANNFGLDMMHTARMYRLHLEFLDLWQALFPGRVTVVPYERLTEDQEAESRKLVAAAGLEWQDACLEFHKNARAVRTASAAQVKRKMYTGSSEAWRRYEPFLGPMLEALEGVEAGR